MALEKWGDCGLVMVEELLLVGLLGAYEAHGLRVRRP